MCVCFKERRRKMIWFSRLNTLNKFSSVTLLLQTISVVLGVIYMNIPLLIFSLFLFILVSISCYVNGRRLSNDIRRLSKPGGKGK